MLGGYDHVYERATSRGRVGLQPAVRALGAKRLDLVAERDVAALVEEMVANGRAPRTISLTLGLLRPSLDSAVREGSLQRNVARLVDRMPERQQEFEVWTAEEARAFLDATATHRLAGPWALTVSGLR